MKKYHGQKINLTEAITREVISEVEKTVEAKKPFYLYMSHYAVHAPFEPDRRFLPNYSNTKWNAHKKKYSSMLESMDKSLGDLMETIDRLGIAEDTIIIFMSDNGSLGKNPRNLPLRGQKISGYEGGNRVPLIVHWPKVTATGKRNATPVIIDDIFPTILEMTGQDAPRTTDKAGFPFCRTTPPRQRNPENYSGTTPTSTTYHPIVHCDWVTGNSSTGTKTNHSNSSIWQTTLANPSTSPTRTLIA